MLSHWDITNIILKNIYQAHQATIASQKFNFTLFKFEHAKQEAERPQIATFAFVSNNVTQESNTSIKETETNAGGFFKEDEEELQEDD